MVCKIIQLGEEVPITFANKESKLILEHTFVGNNITDLLEQAIVKGNTITIHISLEDLEDLLGYIAAESNHAKCEKLEDELDDLYEKLQEIAESYSEEDENLDTV